MRELITLYPACVNEVISDRCRNAFWPLFLAPSERVRMDRCLDSHLYLWPLAAAVTDDEDTTKTRPADGRSQEPELVIKTRTTDVGGRGRWRTEGRKDGQRRRRRQLSLRPQVSEETGPAACGWSETAAAQTTIGGLRY